jgi:hypothetical protein
MTTIKTFLWAIKVLDQNNILVFPSFCDFINKSDGKGLMVGSDHLLCTFHQRFGYALFLGPVWTGGLNGSRRDWIALHI